jgi:hypothetical protein
MELRLTAEMAEALEEWRARQRPVPTVQEAVRRLLGRQLTAEGIIKPDVDGTDDGQ